MKSLKLTFTLLFILFLKHNSIAQAENFSVIAYYMGDGEQINEYEVDKLTHIIFSFCHLKDNKLYVDNARDTATIEKLVALKQQHPRLKVMLSLGGWGGCAPCSEAFSTPEGRKIFAQSVKDINSYFGTDGIDLDWEYPTIEGHPGHLYQPQDKQNFTSLVSELRHVLGDENELSFAAGGFQKFLDESVEWEKIMPLLDRVNIMSYDLVNGYATVTGHHTPLYGTRPEDESTDRAVNYLLNLGIPSEKLVIGAAFYTRVWKDVPATNNGLYQKGEHTKGYNFRSYTANLTSANGWEYFWDDKGQAPYWYNKKLNQFATGDDPKSVEEKAKYALDKKLGGIMFWELTLDTPKEGLLQTIDNVVNQ
ncbi:glycoside hydrolase family 18 protein [Olivibacter sp. SDN3]|uniref:glycoside hydrolase family 18 protein n=1 Tax=Olivibacter sp. SDN3 TaxID=2764720 RepID=UPI0016516AC9|nr:glycoside hydrolase family 18 protein [Olivibacter sp. SDN3]QNL48292.1 glycoside hydrolase family 18 protein [Olivibacter sp. SDN3]